MPCSQIVFTDANATYLAENRKVVSAAPISTLIGDGVGKKNAPEGAFFVSRGRELLSATDVGCAQCACFAALQRADGFSTNFGAGAGVALVNGNKRIDVAA